MRKTFLVFWIAFAVILTQSSRAFCEYNLTYSHFIQSGKKELREENYAKALMYFNRAHLVEPESQEPLDYINLIKRLLEGRINIVVPKAESTQEHRRTLDKALDQYKQKSLLAPSAGSVPVKRTDIIQQALDMAERAGRQEAAPSGKAQEPSGLPKTYIPAKKTALIQKERIVYLNDTLWQAQPKTQMDIELHSTVVLEGNHIERYLILTPGFITVNRIDRDHISVTGDKRGSTYLHVWDEKGRWTFRVEVIFPIQGTPAVTKEQSFEEYAEPFKVSYSADWSSFYDGPSLYELGRENLNFLQWVGIFGDTPYGDFDTSVAFNKFEETTEATGYTIGLTNGRIGSFKDFTIRGYDASKNFSPLSLPGQYFRGFLFESMAFNHKVQYTYLRGRNRATYGFLAPDVLERRESFIEGGRIVFFPEDESRYAFNYVHGFGSAREPFLSQAVYSLQGRQKIDKFILDSEIAYDQESFAGTFGSKYQEGPWDVRLNFRDIESDYTTITSLPSNRGEIGGNAILNFSDERFDAYANVDVYRDRYLPNVHDPDTYNYDISASLEVPIDTTSNWGASAYYIHTPGELSPRRNVRAFLTYSKYFNLWNNRGLTAFVRSGYQKSRFAEAPASEYDRYSVSTGFRAPLIRNLSYFINYEYSWVDDRLTGDRLTPNVMNTGINYSRKITDAWTGNVNFSYRNEEQTQGANSFMAGEDSIIGSLGLNYQPSQDFEFFFDGRMRNVWAEEEQNSAYNEVDVRWGVRTTWDLPLVWNPQGVVEGFVFKDLNGNRKIDKDERGIPNVLVHVGKTEVYTDADGYYKAKIKAKRVRVSIGLETVPAGFVFTTPVFADVDIVPHKVQEAHFGLSAESGIYGIVFYDRNNNDKPDAQDEFIPRVRIILDGEKETHSDFEGTYVFKDIAPGEHTVTLDVNSLPIEYLPKIKIKNNIDVQEGTTYILHVPLEKKSE